MKRVRSIAFGAYRPAIAVDFAQLMKKRIVLWNFFFVHRTNSAMKITPQSGKSDSKAHPAHFDIAFPQCPKTAEGFLGVIRHQHGIVF